MTKKLEFIVVITVFCIILRCDSNKENLIPGATRIGTASLRTFNESIFVFNID